jgi:hypothetical protein
MEKREKMGDAGKAITGIIQERMMRNTSEALAAARARGELGPRVPHAALSRLAALSLADEKKGAVSIESRGNCGICEEEVIAAIGGDPTKGHDRLRSKEFGGRYFHMECATKLCAELSKARG